MSTIYREPEAPLSSYPAVHEMEAVRVPAEGEGGVYTQSWFPLCLSSEIASGAIVGVPFLGGRVIIYRDEQGLPRVQSAYCPHVGADLSLGKIVDGKVQCPFHKYEFDVDGRCVKTGIGDPPPRGARLFSFPAEERYGVIWAFNGEAPLFQLPSFAYPEDELEIEVYVGPPTNCDGWVFATNTCDVQHLVHLHEMKEIDVQGIQERAVWNDWGFIYNLKGIHGVGCRIDWDISMRGSTSFYQQGMVDDWWLGIMVGFSLPGPQEHRAFVINAVRREADTDEARKRAREQLGYAAHLSEFTVLQDAVILQTMHFRPRAFTRTDRLLAKFLRYLKKYPRAHPSAPLIN
ncbi:Rieske 2Fe-2S domain-containing protein [Sphingomonas sp.]|uniref:Rieske 2Fe-2S domain-containing protein n=1 Tax=Sphingomonas sp. TaxID=28214 RepID=UPI003B000615